MNFFEDMRSKYGFSDGEAVPDGIEKYREVAIRVLNKMAETLGSGVRAYAYDRGGCHNWCLLLFAPVGETAVCTEDVLATGVPHEYDLGDMQPDALMETAIWAMDDMDWQGCISVVVSVNDDLLNEVLQEAGATAVALRDEEEVGCED